MCRSTVSSLSGNSSEHQYQPVTLPALVVVGVVVGVVVAVGVVVGVVVVILTGATHGKR